MSDYRTIEGNRKNSLLYVSQSLAYIKDRTDPKKLFLKCRKCTKGCKGRAVIDMETDKLIHTAEHNCDTTELEIKVTEAKTQLKRKAEVSSVNYRELYENETSLLDVEVAKELGFSKVYNTMAKRRRAMAIPVNSDVVFDEEFQFEQGGDESESRFNDEEGQSFKVPEFPMGYHMEFKEEPISPTPETSAGHLNGPRVGSREQWETGSRNEWETEIETKLEPSDFQEEPDLRSCFSQILTALNDLKKESHKKDVKLNDLKREVKLMRKEVKEMRTEVNEIKQKMEKKDSQVHESQPNNLITG